MSPGETEVLVIGSGIAGLTFALQAAERASVLLVTKKERAASSTNYAQGGIAAVMSPDDSFDLHIGDTLVAGAGLCHRDAVEQLVREGPARVRELMDWGVRFTRERDELSLGREGGHSRRRIVHARDLTGREIEEALLQAVADHPNVELLEDQHALDLVVGTDLESGERRCVGALALSHRTGVVTFIRARMVMLATGGIGQAYRHTTNPEIATGDGVAMAYRAGAELRNLEFVQFHPTALYPAEGRAFLISEAVRGEGAVLRKFNGDPLMEGVHPLASLAPRDIVARAIDAELKESGDPHVWLDLSPIPGERVREWFPNIVAECNSRGIRADREPIPVVPAAHYSCGGVYTDADGRTTLPGLYAAGEVACTGVHGANRLASNSLLEAVVYSYRAARQVPGELTRQGSLDTLPSFGAASASDADRAAVEETREGLRNLMWEDAGIIRSNERLARAATQIAEMRAKAAANAVAFAPSPESIELLNLLDTAELVVRCARERRESRGLNYNTDYPYRDNEGCLRDTVVRN